MLPYYGIQIYAPHINRQRCNSRKEQAHRMMSRLAVGYDCTKKSLPLKTWGTCSATLFCYLILLSYPAALSCYLFCYLILLPYPARPYPGFILALHLTICSLRRRNSSLDCWTRCWRREAQETGGEDFISLLHLRSVFMI